MDVTVLWDSRSWADAVTAAWGVEPSETSKTDDPWIRELEFGRKNPHYILPVRVFAGDLLGVELRGGPSQGKPATEALTLEGMRARFGRDFSKQLFYIRGSGFWSMKQAFDLQGHPAVLFLKFEREGQFRK